MATGQLWDWGLDDCSQLGDGSTTNQMPPQQIAGMTDVLETSGGQNYSVLLRSS